MAAGFALIGFGIGFSYAAYRYFYSSEEEDTQKDSKDEVPDLLKEKEEVYNDSIAKDHGLNTADLLAANPEVDKAKPLPSKIYIPKVPENYKKLGQSSYHIVRSGETLLSIAKDKQIKLEELELLNPQVKDGFSLPGDVVFLKSL